jgi:hypothetical protein
LSGNNTAHIYMYSGFVARQRQSVCYPKVTHASAIGSPLYFFFLRFFRFLFRPELEASIRSVGGPTRFNTELTSGLEVSSDTLRRTTVDG